jgi:uncharacterized integral membrane protein
MKRMKARWRLYVNFLLLSLVLITSFQNCSESKSSTSVKNTPMGIEVVTE